MFEVNRVMQLEATNVLNLSGMFGLRPIPRIKQTNQGYELE